MASFVVVLLMVAVIVLTAMIVVTMVMEFQHSHYEDLDANPFDEPTAKCVARIASNRKYFCISANACFNTEKNSTVLATHITASA